MLSVTLEYEIPQDRTITLKVPAEVQPGKHRLIVVIDEQPSAPRLLEPGNADALNQLVGALHLTEDPLAFQQRLREEWE